MTPRKSVIGQLAHLRVLSQFRWRALLLGGLAASFAVLAFFPERYLATSSFTPSDRGAPGLGGTPGHLGALNGVFGNQAAVEVALRVGNGVAVRDDVIEKTRLKDRLKSDGRVALQRYLARNVEVRSIRGGIIVIEMENRDAEWARDIVGAYQAAVQEELGRISRRQTAYKRDVLVKLVQNASDQLGKAQANYDQFRLRNRGAGPRAAMTAIGDRIPQLERELDVAKALYDGYMRYLRGMAVEDLMSDATLRVLESPHVDTQRRIWLPALALAIALFLLWMAIEVYRLRPPPGEAIRNSRHD